MSAAVLRGMLGLTGRVAVVTGAGTTMGIGRSTVMKLAAAGARAIYATDIRTTHFQDLKSAVASVAPDCELITSELDVTNEKDTEELCTRIVREQGRLDFYMANAGFANIGNLWTTSTKDLQVANETMVIGPFLGIKYGSRAMAVTSADKPEAKGSIVVTGSIASVTGGCSSPAYTAAKHAALGIARRGAIELAGTQIRVNAIGPGLTRTHLWETSKELGTLVEPEGDGGPTAQQQSTSTAPLKKDYIQQPSEADDIGNVALFLASDMSRAVDAEIIMADRGHLQQCYLGWTPPISICKIEDPVPLV